MTLDEIKNGTAIQTVIWTCNLFTFGGLDETKKKSAENILVCLLDKLILIQNKPYTQEDILSVFQETVSQLEKLLDEKPLNDGWIYEYGGLNCLFAEIMLALGLPVEKGEYYWKSNFVYGVDFD